MTEEEEEEEEVDPNPEESRSEEASSTGPEPLVKETTPALRSSEAKNSDAASGSTETKEELMSSKQESKGDLQDVKEEHSKISGDSPETGALNKGTTSKIELLYIS